MIVRKALTGKGLWNYRRTKQAHSISRAFVKGPGPKGYTIKGTFGFFSTRPRVW